MRLYTLGTSHGAREKGRDCSANLICVNDAYYLFDCGGNVEGKMQDLGILFDDLRSVFISHMHEDHVGSLSSIVKRFSVYNKSENSLQLYLPEQNGINVFQQWVKALHLPSSEKVSYHLVDAGEIYRDENIKVKAIPTKHLMDGLFPSYAYVIETADNKKILYTGDLNYKFIDYPTIVFEEEFDLILCELVHFKPELHLETIKKSRTKKMIFTHVALSKAERVKNMADQFPFAIDVAEDLNCYEI